MLYRSLKIVALILIPYNAFCQSKLDSLESLFGTWYDSVVEQEASELMYNSIYLTKLRGRTTHQYFDKRDWQNGSLSLSGELYRNVAMLFDIERDQLIIKHPEAYRTDGIMVDMNSLQSFTLAGHHFRKYKFSGRSSFYDVLVDGNQVTLLAKRKKKSSPKKEGIELDATINYFIPVEDRLISIKGINTLIKLYPSHKLTMQSIKKEEKVRMRIRKEETVVRFIELLDSKMNADNEII